MSAYMVEAATVDAIAQRATGGYSSGGADWSPDGILQRPELYGDNGALWAQQWNEALAAGRAREPIVQTVGRLLFMANAAGMREKYGDDNSALIAAYRHQHRDGPAAVVMIKACRCFNYQACEWSGWETSLAHHIVGMVEGAAIRSLPGYEAAPWGLDDRTCPPTGGVSILSMVRR